MSATKSTDSPVITNELIDDRHFKFQVYFWNNDGRLVKIPKGTITELEIVDDIGTWYHSGFITIKNPKDVLERAEESYTQQDKIIDIVPYRFRNDGRDYIYIELDIPVEDDVQSTTSINNEVFSIHYLMSMYDIEDVLTGNPDDKLKRIHFWDYRQQIFAEKNLGWSTSHALKRQSNVTNYKSPHLLQDNERGCLTGDAIRDLIESTLTSPTTKPKFAANFSKGGSKVVYTSPSNSKISDDLDWLLGRHVHDTKSKEPCVLRCNRFNDEWTLMSLNDYYKKVYNKESKAPGELLRDKFYIGNESLPDEISQNKQRTPSGQTALNNFFVDSNVISEYEYSPMSVIDGLEFASTNAVHIYDNLNKQFFVGMEESDIEEYKNYMEKTFLSEVYADSQTGPMFNTVLNKSKTENKTIKHIHTYTKTKTGNTIAGRNRMIKGTIVYGDTLHFVCKGLTSRQACRFISIERDHGGAKDSEFDDKLLGNYFVTRVTHSISANGYYNEVFCTKPYTFKKHEYNTEVS